MSLYSLFHNNQPLRKDELLYGWLANYDQHWDVRRKEISRKAFGQPNATAVIDFPSHLQYLSDHLVYPQPNADELIDQHTMLPAYMPSLSPERIKEVRRLMKADGGSKVQYMIGLGSKVISTQHLQACPACIDDDTWYGEDSTWYRLPQLPGAILCPVHEIPFEVSNVQARGNRLTRHRYISVAKAKFQRMELPSDWEKHRPVLLWLSQQWQWLLNHPSMQFPTESRYIFRRFLFEQGFASSTTGTVRRKKFIDALNKAYPMELLRTIGGQTFDESITRIARYYSAGIHPLNQLLVLHFLGKKPADVLLPYKERGVKLHCFNPLCPNFESVCVTYQKPHFGCSTCGRLIQMKKNGRETIEQGWLWDDKLREIWLHTQVPRNEVLDLFELDRHSLKGHLERLDIPFERPWIQNGQRQVRYLGQRPISKELRTSKKTEWLHILQTYPNEKYSVLDKKYSGLVRWLMKHETEWFEQNRPQVQPRAPRKLKKYIPLEDFQLWLKIQKQALNILQNNNYCLSKRRLTQYTRSFQFVRKKSTPLAFRALQYLPESHQTFKSRNEPVDNDITWPFLSAVKEDMVNF